MNPENVEKQLEKWRSQERVNRLIINTALVLLGVIILGGVTVFAVSLFRPAPTLTPSEFRDQFQDLRGKTVQIRGRVMLLREDAFQFRVVDDQNLSILCQLAEPVGLKDGEVVTVRGKVAATGGLTECEIVD
jgi:hypothetical protein